MVMMAFGSCTSNVRSSAYTAMYSHKPLDYLIYVSGSGLWGKKLISRKSLEKCACRRDQLDQRPYNYVYISSVFPSFSPNSCPAMI